MKLVLYSATVHTFVIEPVTLFPTVLDTHVSEENSKKGLNYARHEKLNHFYYVSKIKNQFIY